MSILLISRKDLALTNYQAPTRSINPYYYQCALSQVLCKLSLLNAHHHDAVQSVLFQNQHEHLEDLDRPLKFKFEP